MKASDTTSLHHLAMNNRMSTSDDVSYVPKSISDLHSHSDGIASSADPRIDRFIYNHITNSKTIPAFTNQIDKTTIPNLDLHELIHQTLLLFAPVSSVQRLVVESFSLLNTLPPPGSQQLGGRITNETRLLLSFSSFC